MLPSKNMSSDLRDIMLTDKEGWCQQKNAAMQQSFVQFLCTQSMWRWTVSSTTTPSFISISVKLTEL